MYIPSVRYGGCVDLQELGIGAPGKIMEYMSAQVAPHLLVISFILSTDIPSGRGSCASQRISWFAWTDIACRSDITSQHLVHWMGALWTLFKCCLDDCQPCKSLSHDLARYSSFDDCLSHNVQCSQLWNSQDFSYLSKI